MARSSALTRRENRSSDICCSAVVIRVSSHSICYADLVRFAVVVEGGTFGRSFDSWGKLRMELLRANVLSPAYLTHAEDNFYRGESWQSPDTVPMTDGQLKELKLKRQDDQNAILRNSPVFGA
jgi:hypothetical protein